MGIIAWIILGLVAGMVSKMLVPGRDPHGLVITTLIGIAGALLRGFLVTPPEAAYGQAGPKGHTAGGPHNLVSFLILLICQTGMEPKCVKGCGRTA